MIYRKAPPQPGRFLLRVVAGAGAVALAGAVACSGDDGVHGVATIPPRDGGPDTQVGGGSSSGVFDASGSSSGGFDASGFMGFTDSGEVDAITEAAPGCDGCGIVVNPDASADAPADVVTGIIVHPDGGGD